MRLFSRRPALLGALLGWLLLAGNSQADSLQPTHEFTLDNGLRVIVREDHRAPVVVSQLWYRVGSSDEPPGLTGISHALEHMMFKGSERVAPGQASRLLSQLGAQENAFTSRDYTAYYQIIGRDQLAIALELEAERMHRLSLPEDEFLREMEVIREERRLRVDDNPNGLAWERFSTQAWMASPYGQPVIGWMHDIERLTIDDLRYWYQRHYRPANALLVVVGDVTLDEVRGLAERYFGPVPGTPAPPRKAALELPGGGERFIQLRPGVQLPTLLMAFNVPGLQTAAEPWEADALRLLAAVLDGGYGSRLISRLERGTQQATRIGASYDGFTRGDSLFVFSGIPNNTRGVDLDQLEQALWQQIEELQNQPPAEAELQRARTRMQASQVYARDSISQQATQIGQLESIGLSWQLIDSDAERLAQISPEQVSEVARRYLQRERLTRAHVLPDQENQP